LISPLELAPFLHRFWRVSTAGCLKRGYAFFKIGCSTSFGVDGNAKIIAVVDTCVVSEIIAEEIAATHL
jgi:hypothetical protein